MFLAGMFSLTTLLAMAAVAVGCIFDEGGTYEGGGRRTTTPTANQTSTASVLDPGTSSSSGTGIPDTGIQ